MPDLPSFEDHPILAIYLLMSQYPVLAKQIRQRMRDELFRRGVVTPEQFEKEVREKALASQQREGMSDPLRQESPLQWDLRQESIRGNLTDFYFAYNLPLDLLHRLVNDLLARRIASFEGLRLTFNPELAPLDWLLQQAEVYEALPPEQRAEVDHHWQEIIVVLTKSIISDQLAFVSLAKQWFTVADFRFIQAQRIGHGKIGGKAAGMLLAHKILRRAAPELADQLAMPRSYFIGADVFYDFLALNEVEYIDQKYKAYDQIRADYPQIQAEYLRGRFPEEVAERLRAVLAEVGRAPLIVRSSSLLEDNFGALFAGKYVSCFCPNQGTPKENLRDLTIAIRRVYASVYSPDALFYRRRMGLLDYDERMAILLQEVQGHAHRHYYFPHLAGVAFSYSPIVWNPRLRREDGFVRLVTGLGTHAVDRVDSDFPRIANLSHPQLRPEVTRAAVRHYAQRFMDVIDLENNALVSRPVSEIIGADFAPLRWLASVDDGDTLQPLYSIGPHLAPEQLVLTFDTLLGRTDFAPLLRTVLATLQKHYHKPVDVEFTVSVTPAGAKPRLLLHLLQCRPQNRAGPGEQTAVPDLARVPEADRLFLSTRMAPQGQVAQVEYVVYVDPEVYHHLPTPADHREVARLIGRLNKALEARTFILIGPGRWGSSDYTLGVPVTYAEIFNTRALVEMAVRQHGLAPDPSYGTHFFQDLVEAKIFPLAVYPDEQGDFFNQNFIDQSANALLTLLPNEHAPATACVKVLRVPAARAGRYLELAMDGQKALAYVPSE